MKKSILLSCAAMVACTLLTSCEKKNSSPDEAGKNSNPPPQTTLSVDTNLIGTWVLDSAKYDGYPTDMYGGGSKDSVFINDSLYSEKIYYNGSYLSGFSHSWYANATKDSLFTINASKYLITPGKLFLYMKSSAPPNHKYWYHKK